MEGTDGPASSRALYERGQALLDADDFAQALPLLAAAQAKEPGNARYRSSYGLCVALRERDFARGLELCETAVKQEFFNPDLYLNLARLHLAFGFKSDGLRNLKRGRMIDPSNAVIERELAVLGLRRGPVLRFLPRNHAFNRWFGRALHRVSSAA